MSARRLVRLGIAALVALWLVAIVAAFDGAFEPMVGIGLVTLVIFLMAISVSTS